MMSVSSRSHTMAIGSTNGLTFGSVAIDALMAESASRISTNTQASRKGVLYSTGRDNYPQWHDAIIEAALQRRLYPHLISSCSRPKPFTMTSSYRSEYLQNSHDRAYQKECELWAATEDRALGFLWESLKPFTRTRLRARFKDLDLTSTVVWFELEAWYSQHRSIALPPYAAQMKGLSIDNFDNATSYAKQIEQMRIRHLDASGGNGLPEHYYVAAFVHGMNLLLLRHWSSWLLSQWRICLLYPANPNRASTRSMEL